MSIRLLRAGPPVMKSISRMIAHGGNSVNTGKRHSSFAAENHSALPACLFPTRPRKSSTTNSNAARKPMIFSGHAGSMLRHSIVTRRTMAIHSLKSQLLSVGVQ